MATDIAMAVGVVSLLGSRVAPSLKLFLLALAIVDDIGAILVIAIFYSDDISVEALIVAACIVGLIALMRWVGVRLRRRCTSCAGVGLWLAVFESGLHATLAGVILGLMAPTRPIRQRQLVDEEALLDLSSVEAAARDGDARPRVGVGRRVDGAPAAPVDELPHRAAVRARERRDPDHVDDAFERGDVTRHLRRRARPRRRQVRRCRRSVVDRDSAADRHPPRRRVVAGHHRSRCRRRHRLHRLDLRCRVWRSRTSPCWRTRRRSGSSPRRSSRRRSARSSLSGDNRQQPTTK